MAAPPQAQMNAPSGPRNPHIETEESRKGESFWNVVVRMTKAQEIPASIPDM
jgi:hypothetical protein